MTRPSTALETYLAHYFASSPSAFGSMNHEARKAMRRAAEDTGLDGLPWSPCPTCDGDGCDPCHHIGMVPDSVLTACPGCEDTFRGPSAPGHGCPVCNQTGWVRVEGWQDADEEAAHLAQAEREGCHWDGDGNGDPR